MKSLSKLMLSAATATALVFGMAIGDDADARGKARSRPAGHSNVQREVVRQPVGHRVTAPPRGHVKVRVGQSEFRYHRGVFYRFTRGGYRIVAAPIGAFVARLPFGYTTFYLGARPYYEFNDTCFVWSSARRGYVVVERPFAGRHYLVR